MRRGCCGLAGGLALACAGMFVQAEEPKSSEHPVVAVAEPEQPARVEPLVPAPLEEAPVVMEVDWQEETPREGGLYAAYAATFFRPRFGGNSGGTLGINATSALSVNVPIVGTVVLPTVPLAGAGGVADYSRESDGRWWLGFQSAAGLGARVRYSHYHSNSDPLDAQATGTGTGTLLGLIALTSTVTETDRSLSTLGLDVLDLDATYEAAAGNWSLLTGLGARYANLQRRTNLAQTFARQDQALLFGFIPVGSAQTNQSLVQQTQQEFNNWGPTFALEARRRLTLGRLRGAGFVNFRTSRLVGDTTIATSSATTSLSVVDTVLGGSTTASSTATGITSERPTATTILELEVGLETGWQTSFGEFFIRGSWEGQQWRHGGDVIGTSVTSDHLYLTGWTIGGGWRF